jgi:hypothetical protein
VTRSRSLAVVVALGLAAVTLLAVELGRGALDYGERASENPCTARVSFRGEGLDASLQRIALDGLNGAACRLGTTREELVLAFDPSLGDSPRWNRATIERAVRAGLLRSIDEAEDRGSLGSTEAFLLREVVRRAPIDWLIEGASLATDLFETLRDDLGDLLDELDGGE